MTVSTVSQHSPSTVTRAANLVVPIVAVAVLGVVWAHVITAWSGRSIAAPTSQEPTLAHLDELVWWQLGHIVVTMATSWWFWAITLVAVAAIVLVGDALLRAGDNTPLQIDVGAVMRVAGTGCVLLAAFLVAFTVTGGAGIGAPSVAWAVTGVVLWCIGIDGDDRVREGVA